MSQERLILRGMLEEKKQKAREIEIQADGLVKSIRLIINVYEKLKDLDVVPALVQIRELDKLKQQHAELLKEIRILENEL